MVFRFGTVIFALTAVASSNPVGYETAPTIIKSYAPAFVKTFEAPVYKQVKYEAPAEYVFSYSVHDDHTGDMKSQQESRKGDVVHGRYELIEPDGYKRIVEYTADDHHGFNAVVRREPTNIRIPQQVPQVQKIIAPVAKIIAPVAKIAYAAPVTKIAYAAPVVTKIVAPVAPIVKYSDPAGHYSSGHEISHVTFSGPGAHYRY